MSCQDKPTSKQPRWLSKSAILLVVAFLVETRAVVSFSPVAEGSVISSSRAGARRKQTSQVGFTNEEHDRGETDIRMVTSTLLKPIHANWESPGSLPSPDDQPRDATSFPSSSRVVSVKGKRNRLSRMVRPKSLSSRARVEGQTVSIKKHSTNLLTKEEEKNLTLRIRSLRQAIRIRDDLVTQYEQQPTESQWAEACGLDVIDLRRVMHEGQEARSTLVSRNVGLVTSIAKKHYHSLKQATQSGGMGTILTLQDMVQEGNLGIMQAAERYEPERGFRFSTYATYWVRQRILRAISDSSRIIRLPAHVHSMLKKISKARKEMMQTIGREPSAPELAHYMEIPEDKLRKYASSSRTVVSLEMPLKSGGSFKDDQRTLGEYLVSDAPTPEEDAQRHHLKEEIRSVLSDLPKRERDVLNLRYGLENGESMTLSDTAKHIGISEDSVRLVEARALNKLRSPQRNYKLKEYVNGKADEELARSKKKVEEKKRSSPKMWF